MTGGVLFRRLRRFSGGPRRLPRKRCTARARGGHAPWAQLKGFGIRYIGVSKNQGPLCTQYTKILVIGTPKKEPLFVETPHMGYEVGCGLISGSFVVGTPQVRLGKI